MATEMQSRLTIQLPNKSEMSNRETLTQSPLERRRAREETARFRAANTALSDRKRLDGPFFTSPRVQTSRTKLGGHRTA